MNCNIVKDLIPLCIDGCCSKDSEALVCEHIAQCDACKALYEDMKTPTDTVTVTTAPITMRKLNDWKASVLQSVLFFLSFALITFGVAMEAQTPSGLTNGLWAMQLVIPTTGFLLSLANWYFVKLYKSRKQFSACSLLCTFGITAGAYIWSLFHYGTAVMVSHLSILSLLLVAVFCIASMLFSNQYAKMLGKE